MVDTTHLGELADEYRKLKRAADAAGYKHKSELIRIRQEELAEYHELARMAFEAFYNEDLVVPELSVQWSEKLRKMLTPKHYPNVYPTEDELREIFAAIKELREKVPLAVPFIKELLEKN